MIGYRTGAKQEDVNRIRVLAAEGKTVAEISRQLLIVEPCVASFVESFQKKETAAQPAKPGRKKKEVSDDDLPPPPYLPAA